MTIKRSRSLRLIASNGCHAPIVGMMSMHNAGLLATGCVYIAGKTPQSLTAHLGVWCRPTARGRTCSLHRKPRRRFCWIRIRRTPARTNRHHVALFFLNLSYQGNHNVKRTFILSPSQLYRDCRSSPQRGHELSPPYRRARCWQDRNSGCDR